MWTNRLHTQAEIVLGKRKIRKKEEEEEKDMAMVAYQIGNAAGIMGFIMLP